MFYLYVVVNFILFVNFEFYHVLNEEEISWNNEKVIKLWMIIKFIMKQNSYSTLEINFIIKLSIWNQKYVWLFEKKQYIGEKCENYFI